MKTQSKSHRGFTLIELLVVIAIIALLMSIVTPGLRMAKEVAKRTVCANNLKGLGRGIYVYANGHNDLLPPSYYKAGATGADLMFAQPSASYLLFELKTTGISLSTPPVARINTSHGFGYLFKEGIVQEGEVFYCPSTPESPAGAYDHRYITYSNNGSTYPWNKDYDAKLGNYWFVRSSYNYVPQASKTRKQNSLGSGTGYFPDSAKKSFQLYGDYAMACDLLYKLDFLPHKKGNKQTGSGVNVLFGDASVRFSNNPDAFTAALWGTAQSPRDLGKDEYLFRTILSLLK